MSQLPIYNCFNPILRQKSIDLTEFTQENSDFVRDMIETMNKADGAGLAANQVGHRESIIVIDQKPKEKEPLGNSFVLINPKIVAVGEKLVPYKEGCLSIPGYFESVIRPDEIEVTYLDEKLKEHKITVDGRLSRVIQHEVDHLNGLLFYDRLSALKQRVAKSRIKKIEKLEFRTIYPMINPDGSFRAADKTED